MRLVVFVFVVVFFVLVLMKKNKGSAVFLRGRGGFHQSAKRRADEETQRVY
jgi:hypothetical protein